MTAVLDKTRNTQNKETDYMKIFANLTVKQAHNPIRKWAKYVTPTQTFYFKGCPDDQQAHKTHQLQQFGKLKSSI